MKIKSIRRVVCNSKKYDLQTSSQNFFANRVLVHNSMLTAIVIDDKVIWGTKRGPTDVSKPVDEFAAKNGYYNDFVYDLHKSGMTAIFEWCSPIQRIVIDYPVSQLILTAVRKNVTGEYIPYADLFALAEPYGIPVVDNYGQVTNLKDFIHETRNLVGAEGYVVRFNDGHMIKVKGDWYVNLHRTIDLLRQEKDVIKLVLSNQIDDAKGCLPERYSIALDAYTCDLYSAMNAVATHVYEIAGSVRGKYASRREMAEYVNKTHSALAPFIFWAYDRYSDGVPRILEDMVKTILKKTGSGPNLNQVRHLFDGVVWSRYISEDIVNLDLDS